jgi:prepilin-type N-terminal cleavage/methylation domain-containing protein
MMNSMRHRRPSQRSGFTLIEVLIAILIVAVVAIVLIYRRIDVVRDAARVRAERVAWTLAALKLGDMSRDPAALLDADSGDFSEDAPDLADFQWSYEAQWEPIPLDAVEGQTVRSLRRIHLKILDADDVELQSIEAMFPDTREQTP